KPGDCSSAWLEEIEIRCESIWTRLRHQRIFKRCLAEQLVHSNGRGMSRCCTAYAMMRKKTAASGVVFIDRVRGLMRAVHRIGPTGAAIAPSSAVAAAISPAVEPAAGQRLRECFPSQRLLIGGGWPRYGV